MSLEQLRVVSYLAPNLFWFYSAVAAGWERALGQSIQIRQSQIDPLADPLLLQDQCDIAFICGLPLMQHSEQAIVALKTIAAPVMQASRYQARPIYFSDLIVSANSSLRSFEHLSGKTFCYNDSGSNSGYNLVRQRLLHSGYAPSFFGQAIASGSHQTSIRWVVEGIADCAAIDSLVLEQDLRLFPHLAPQIRIIESLGPCAMPPVVVSSRLSTRLIHRLQAALLHPDQELQSAMAQAGVKEYIAVELGDYQAIAQMYQDAIQAGYEVLG